ncbi:DUF2188 domain-containing protein [Synechococcus sp. PCC 6312]
MFHVRPRPGGGWQVKQEGIRKTKSLFNSERGDSVSSTRIRA